LEHSKLAKRLWILLFLTIAAFYFYGLGAYPFVGPDEPRYAEVAREMLVHRDFITPTLGGLPWFEKPPMLYWLMAASYRVFGVNEYAARLGPALCGLLTAAFVWWMARAVDQTEFNVSPADEIGRANSCKLANWSTLVFLSSLGAIIFSRAASFDIVLTMTLTGAFAAFFVAHIRHNATSEARQIGRQRRLLFMFYFFIGLSLLAKGLVGLVIPIGVLALFFILRREWPDKLSLKSLSWGIPIVLLVAGAWYGPMIHRHGWRFVDQFIVQHHFARFLTNKYHHPQPLYYYLPTLVWMILPWTIFLGAGLFSTFHSSWGDPEPLNRLRMFALSWIAVPLLFFSFSGSKLPGYILPILPAVAIVVGERLTCFRRVAGRKSLVSISAIVVIVSAAAGSWYAVRTLDVSRLSASIPGLVLAAAAVWALCFPQLRTTIWLFALSSFFVAGIAIHSTNAITSRQCVRDLIATANENGYSSTPVFLMLSDDRTAEFYAGGRLAYQPDGEPIRFDGARELGDAIRQRGGVALVIIETRWEKQLTDYTVVQAERIGSNGTSTVFAVQVH